MSGSVLAFGELVALAYVTFALGISAACAGLYPLVRDRLHSWAPADRAAWIFAFTTAPPAGAFLLTAVCLLPSFDGPWWHLVDHCSAHGSDHPHLCLAHLPENAGTVAGLVALGVLSVLFLTMVGDLVRTARLGRQLQDALGDRNRQIDSLQPLAATIGILRPRVVISSALRRDLSEELFAAVLDHENAHVRRRDPLFRMLARLGAFLHVPGTRRQMRRDLHVSCEQACDEQAADQSGDRLLVARALIAVERLLTPRHMTLPASATGFGDTGIIARVTALAKDPIPRSRMWLPFASIGLLLLLVATADRIHHMTETALGLVTR